MYVTYDLEQRTRGGGHALYPKVKRVYIAGDLVDWRAGSDLRKRTGRQVKGVRLEYRQSRERYRRAPYEARRGKTKYASEPRCCRWHKPAVHSGRGGSGTREEHSLPCLGRDTAGQIQRSAAECALTARTRRPRKVWRGPFTRAASTSMRNARESRLRETETLDVRYVGLCQLQSGDQSSGGTKRPAGISLPALARVRPARPFPRQEVVTGRTGRIILLVGKHRSMPGRLLGRSSFPARSAT